MDIVINYDISNNVYKVYEPVTDTLLVTTNLTEALVNLSEFLRSNGSSDILQKTDITYHIDSFTMKGIIESNVNLMKRLSQAPSGFMISNQRFGGTSTGGSNRFAGKKNMGSQFDNTHRKFSKAKSTSNFSGSKEFKSSTKKFGV